MEEMILKCAEFGILGVIVLLLLTKGLNAQCKLAETMQTLADSQKALADSVAKLAEKVASLNTRISEFGYKIEDIERRIDKLEEHSARNFNELRDLIKLKKE